MKRSFAPNGISAIPTAYNGYQFRSRLEARWAVFFDTLGVSYEYECEGFDFSERVHQVLEKWEKGESNTREWFFPEEIEYLRGRDHHWYLPDFYLPHIDKFVEIKPPCDDHDAWWGLPENVYTKSLGGYVVFGGPGPRGSYKLCNFYDIYYYFGHCPKCRAFDQGFEGWAERICKDHTSCGHYRKTYLDESHTTTQAYKAARRHRFR